MREKSLSPNKNNGNAATANAPHSRVQLTDHMTSQLTRLIATRESRTDLEPRPLSHAFADSLSVTQRRSGFLLMS
jgi:hypothetical protein